MGADSATWTVEPHALGLQRDDHSCGVYTLLLMDLVTGAVGVESFNVGVTREDLQQYRRYYAGVLKSDGQLESLHGSGDGEDRGIGVCAAPRHQKTAEVAYLWMGKEGKRIRWLPPSAVKTPTGIKNSGTDCFVSCVVQCLAYDADFDVGGGGTRSGEVGEALTHVLSSLRGNDRTAVSSCKELRTAVSKFKNGVGSTRHEDMATGQHDAGEFFLRMCAASADLLQLTMTVVTGIFADTSCTSGCAGKTWENSMNMVCIPPGQRFDGLVSINSVLAMQTPKGCGVCQTGWKVEVQWPELLVVQRTVAGSSAPVGTTDLFPKCMSVGTEHEGQPVVYELVGACLHAGQKDASAKGSHYVALVRLLGRWYEADDEEVWSSPPPNASDEKHASLLFYRRAGVAMKHGSADSIQSSPLASIEQGTLVVIADIFVLHLTHTSVFLPFLGTPLERRTIAATNSEEASTAQCKRKKSNPTKVPRAEGDSLSMEVVPQSVCPPIVSVKREFVSGEVSACASCLAACVGVHDVFLSAG